ncbi:molecular chaperone GrpE [Myroides gitamensis]|uniref:Protein GrpE n=1 Tax=Myroides odoratus TaxID=256 RepID=A0A378RMP0_MYROD|nr:nucleotide exchange factor GrpE [Myroides odoratus]MCS4239124.1 molecular chaperone GrpE [Myroides odoratus]MDH6599576.1 molecular chaperone GrpE [Myroides gitamensis]QQU04333.1 nucleotide exchange factor GrpE [Myroides odoratus]STZ28245.1 HSP-70 cofactor [Myroides odoratus]
MENKDINKEEVDLNTENTQETETTTADTASVEETLNAKIAEEKDKYLRLFAEFENYKRRTSKERLELFKTANEEVMSAMLPILDDFSRALSELEKQGESEHLTGVRLISSKLVDTLAAKGLEEVVIQSGDVFNADLSEAITQIPAGDELKGKVVDVVEKGYKLGDKIIRFPKVVIGQ